MRAGTHVEGTVEQRGVSLRAECVEHMRGARVIRERETTWEHGGWQGVATSGVHRAAPILPREPLRQRDDAPLVGARDENAAARSRQGRPAHKGRSVC